MKKHIDIDDCIIGNKEITEYEPFEYKIPKVCAYLKETGKKFEDLSEEELEKLK